MVDALRRLAIPDERIDLYWIGKLYHLMPFPDHWVVRQKDLDTKDYMYMKKNLFVVPPCFLYLYQITKELLVREMLMVELGNGEIDKRKHVYGSNWHLYKDEFGKVHRVNMWNVFKNADTGQKFYREPTRLSRPVGREWYPDTQSQLKSKKIYREIHSSIDHDRMVAQNLDQSTSTPTRSPRNKTTEAKAKKFSLIQPPQQEPKGGVGAYYQALRYTTDQWKKTKANIDSQITHKIEFSTTNSRAHMRGYGFNLNPLTRASIKKRHEQAQREKSEGSPRNSVRPPSVAPAKSYAHFGQHNLQVQMGSTLGSGKGFLRASVSAASHNFRSRTKITEPSVARTSGGDEPSTHELPKVTEGTAGQENTTKSHPKLGYYVNRAEEFIKQEGDYQNQTNEDDPFEQFERQQHLVQADADPQDSRNLQNPQNPQADPNLAMEVDEPPSASKAPQTRLVLVSMKDHHGTPAAEDMNDPQARQDTLTLPDENRVTDLQQTATQMNKTAGTIGGAPTRTQTAGFRTTTGNGRRGTNYNSFTRAKRLATADPNAVPTVPTIKPDEAVGANLMARSSAGMFYKRLAEETQSIWSEKIKSAKSQNLFSPYEPDPLPLQRLHANSTLTNYNKLKSAHDTSKTTAVRISVQESVRETQEVALLKRKLASSAPSISLQSLKLALVTPDTTMYQDITQMPIPLGGSRLMSGELPETQTKSKKPTIKEKNPSSRR